MPSVSPGPGLRLGTVSAAECGHSGVRSFTCTRSLVKQLSVFRFLRAFRLSTMIFLKSVSKLHSQAIKEKKKTTNPLLLRKARSESDQ